MRRKKQKFKKDVHKLFYYSIFFIVFSVLWVLETWIESFNWMPGIQSIINAVIVFLLVLVIRSLIHLLITNSKIKNTLYKILFVVAAVAIFFIFRDNLVTLGISLGIAAAVLTFAFQAPILSLIGWSYLLASQLYREGDRIKIGDVKGDVLSIEALHTKILEIGGDNVKSDYPSGRVITIPNSLVLTSPVANYTKYFPYIWTDVNFQLTYESDISFAVDGIKEIIKESFSKKYRALERDYEDFLDDHEFEIGNFEPIRFTIRPGSSWIDLQVTFPVEPEKRAATSSKLTKRILQFFNKNHKKVAFPVGRHR